MARTAKLPKGISRDQYGFRAWVTARGHTTHRHFKRTTPLKEITDWQAIEKGERLSTDSPWVKKPKGRRGAFDADARRYLEAVKAMPSYADRAQHIEEWIAVFGSRRRSKITSDEIRAQLQIWRTETREVRISKNLTKSIVLSASACNKRRTALMHLYSVLDGKAAPNPVRDVPKFQEPSPEPRGVDYRIIEKILAKLPKGKHYARAMVFAYVGIPNALLKRITEADVNWKDRTVWVPERRKGKGSPARLVPLTDDGLKAFRAMQRYEAWGSFSNWRMRKEWRAAQQKAKTGAHVRVYDLRHSFGTAVYEATGDLHATQELLGHSSPTLTARYALAAVPARLRAAVAALSGTDKALTRFRPNSRGLPRIRPERRKPRKTA